MLWYTMYHPQSSVEISLDQLEILPTHDGAWAKAIYHLCLDTNCNRISRLKWWIQSDEWGIVMNIQLIHFLSIFSFNSNSKCCIMFCPKVLNIWNQHSKHHHNITLKVDDGRTPKSQLYMETAPSSFTGIHTCNTSKKQPSVKSKNEPHVGIWREQGAYV